MSFSLPDLIGRLNREFVGWAESLSGDEIDAIRAYQSGAHRLVNGVLRGRIDRTRLTRRDQELFVRTRAGLDSAIGRGVLPSPVRSYRGVRDCEQVFGADTAGLERLIGEEWVLRG